jgi:hypothetical protein
MKTLRDRFVESFAEDPSVRRGRKGRRRASGTGADPSAAIYKHSAALTFMGLTLGVFVSRKFFMIPAAVALTLAQEFGKDRLQERLGRPVTSRR